MCSRQFFPHVLIRITACVWVFFVLCFFFWTNSMFCSFKLNDGGLTVTGNHGSDWEPQKLYILLSKRLVNHNQYPLKGMRCFIVYLTLNGSIFHNLDIRPAQIRHQAVITARKSEQEHLQRAQNWPSFCVFFVQPQKILTGSMGGQVFNSYTVSTFNQSYLSQLWLQAHHHPVSRTRC